MSRELNFVGISGSLRKGSLNTMLLNAAAKLLPEGVHMTLVSIKDIPLYNGDLDLPETTERPEEVEIFRKALAKADALVLVSPEYNYSIPGVLKNAIDWASRGDDSPLLNKAVALMGATPGMWGTVRMQTAFHPVFQFLNMTPVQKPEVLLAKANTKFAEDGKLLDEFAAELIRKKLLALKDLCIKLQ
ncbi:NADPH-dependent FMN reductase [Daejeonella oryzae]|uniref:NADPH-dependent FMN reductase n=1 Tax=Daejeonella oryzae TaxID=1122943 RepID=UPI00042422DA|nr:NAD(P)H-dependent oxidoreductase [Daejeonella oryzae]